MTVTYFVTGVDPLEFRKVASRHRYNEQVFLLPPWEGIFVNGSLRKLSFEDSFLFHETLVDAYDSAGYKLLYVPRVSVFDRVEFVLEHILSHTLKPGA